MKRYDLKKLIMTKLINKWDIPFSQYDRNFDENIDEFAEDIIRTIEEIGVDLKLENE